MLKKALADKAKERHEAAAHAKALAAKVLADKRGGQESAVRSNPLKTVRRRARPCVRVGCRHGPRAPNPHSTFFVVGDIGHERPTNLL